MEKAGHKPRLFLLCSPQGNWTCMTILFSFPYRSLQGRMRSVIKVYYLIAFGFLNSKVPELNKLLMMTGEEKDRQIILHPF